MRTARRFRRRFFLSGLLLAVAACGDSDSTGPGVPSTVVLSATALSFDALQETRQLTATVRDQRGDVLESAPVVWTSSASEVASVSDEGLVTALSGGTATITARSGSASGRASVSVRQIASSIEVSPAVVELQGPGDTATVTVAVSDGGGFEIPGAPLRWESGNEGVVTLSDLGLVTAVGAGSTTITVEATTEGASVRETLDVTVDDGVLAGVEGGRIPVAGGAAVLDIPVGALSEPVFLTAREATGLPAGSEPIAALDFGPQGLVFDGPVTLTMRYDPAALPPGVSEEELWLYELVGDDFELVTGSAVDTEEHTVSGPIEGFSVYAVLPVGTPPVVPPTGFCSDYPPNAIVTFVDEALESWVKGYFPPDQELTCAALDTLPELELYGDVSDLTGIQNLTGLEEFSIIGPTNEVTDISLVRFLTKLRRAAFNGIPVTDISPLAGLTGLEWLDLGYSSSITDYAPLSALTTLETLGLEGSGVSDLSPLAGLESLSNVQLAFNPALRDIQPLLDNPGIGPDDRVDLEETFVSCEDIALLEAKGVRVEHDCLRITTGSLADAEVDVPYSATLEVAGWAVRDFAGEWSVASGALPTGLSLGEDGEISGTPTEEGTFDFTVEYAIPSEEVSVQQPLSLDVASGPPVVPPTGFCSDYPPNAIVTFVDDELENEVRRALEVGPGEDLTCATAATLSRLQLIGVPVSDLTGIQNLSGLERLDVFEVGLTDIGPIGSLPGLTGLTLFWTRVTDISPLAGLTELRSLDLEGSQLIGDYTPLGALTNLRSLSLQMLGIRDLSPLASLTRLSSVNLAETTVTDLGPLSGLTSLSDLVLHSNYALSDIQPLLDNPGIGPGDRIVLQNTSVPCDDIALLEARGVTVVDDCPRITTTTLPDAVVDVPYSYRLEVNGRYFDASPNTDWSVVGGALPAGLSLDDDGTISGTPGEAGTFDFVVEYAVHGGPVVLSDRQPLTLTVGSPLGTGFALDQFSRIPAGTFQMGDITGTGEPRERPVHAVNITRDFYMQRTEVTQAQWQEVMGENPSMYPGCDLCPVEQVSWEDTQTFLARLNATYPGSGFRLPTEAEWEYAARAGTTGDYGGTGVLDEMGWYWGNTPGGSGTSWGDGKKYQPVALKLPNDWGLYDMHGNVYEWVQDWYSPTYYSVSPTNDPTGPPSDPDPDSGWPARVLRGGSFLLGSSSARSSARSSDHLQAPREDQGFRLVRAR